MLTQKPLKTRKEEHGKKQEEQVDLSQKLKSLEKEQNELEKLKAQYSKYETCISKPTEADQQQELAELLHNAKIAAFEQWALNQKDISEEAVIAEFLTKLTLDNEKNSVKPPQQGSHIEKLLGSVEDILKSNQASGSINEMLSQTGASHTETIVRFMEKQKILLPDAFTIKLRKAVNQVFNASERKKPQTLQGNISLISQLIPNLDEIKSEVYKERFEAVKSFGRADFFKPEIYNEKPLTKEKKKEEKIKNKVFKQMLVELTKPKNEKAETKQNTKEKEGNPNKQEEKKVASSDPNPLNPKELAQLKEIYLCELKCQAFQKMLNLLTKAKKDLKRDTIRIKQAFERSSNRQLMEIRGKMLELKDKTDTLNREIMRMEKELNQIKVSQEKNDIETKIQNFIKSASSEEAGQTKLRDYLVVLKKTIEIYYRYAEILEGGLFQKNSGDLIDSALDQLEDLLDNVPFGKYVAKAFKAAKWVYNYRNEVIQDNNYKTFSSQILNSDKLGYILEASALELMMHKKNLILNSSDTIEKTFMEELDEKSKTMFIQKERLAKGLDTGAKKMGLSMLRASLQMPIPT